MAVAASGVASVGFIGAGKMAQALAKGFIAAGAVRAENIWASAPSQRNFQFWQHNGCQTVHDNRDIPLNCDVTIVATKPGQVVGVVKEIKEVKEGRSKDFLSRLLMSVAAGVPLSSFADLVPDVPVIRMMTNTATQVRNGASCFCIGNGDKSDEGVQGIVRHLLGSIGFCEEVDEHHLDAICAVSGSGVAFMFAFLEAIADGAVKVGLPRELAVDLALSTMAGASALAIADRHLQKNPDARLPLVPRGFAKLREDVCSPGGTTIYGIHELERNGFKSAVMDAVAAATKRSVEIGKVITPVKQKVD